MLLNTNVLSSASGWISLEMMGRNVSETEHREEYVILLTLKYVTAVAEKSFGNQDEPGMDFLPRFGQGVNLCGVSRILCVGSRRVWWSQGLICRFF